ncbi:hypothetical protein B296_00026977 [Ensete ventricosum]|uniref:Uncharacterized protein n=1 Tax=Ensete ventricosum TaxID=4639 RepID=A0A426YNQ7_ENSVE|nr:hypothetical protein B296_00026977 [Ensete ventricosum]
MVGSVKLQPDDGSRYNLGIRPSLNDMVGTIWWDIAGNSLGDSPKESGSSLGTRREIAEKKTRGLAVRLLEVAGVCGS